MISDVLIIGGGIIGLSIARELHKGRIGRITIVDQGKAGREASYAAAGMLAPNAESDEIDAFYRLCAGSNEMYGQFAAELFAETGIDIELDRSGTLFTAFTDADSEELDHRVANMDRAGLAVHRLSAAETIAAEPHISSAVRESLFFEDNWQVENRKTVAALIEYAKRNDITIVENECIERLIEAGGKVLGGSSGKSRFYAKTTIIATGAWTDLITINGTALPFSIKPIRGQMIVFHPPRRLFDKVVYSPSAYLVPRKDGRVLAGATVEDVGFDKEVSIASKRYLAEAAAEISPELIKAEIVDAWCGLRPRGTDELPVIGPLPGFEGVFVATGHYRNGILLAPITAGIIADAAAGRDNIYAETFGPQRFVRF